MIHFGSRITNNIKTTTIKTLFRVSRNAYRLYRSYYNILRRFIILYLNIIYHIIITDVAFIVKICNFMEKSITIYQEKDNFCYILSGQIIA